MRELKFRLWDKEYSQWGDMPGYAAWDCSCVSRNNVSWPITNLLSPDSLDKYNENEIIFQQFTGLKDKNGKEIFEGDIVLQTLVNLTSEVKWSNLELAYIIQYPDLTFAYLADFETEYLEVVGNLLETPERLES